MHKPELVRDQSVLKLLAALIGDHPARLAQADGEATLIHQTQMIPDGSLGEVDAIVRQLGGYVAGPERFRGVREDA